MNNHDRGNLKGNYNSKYVFKPTRNAESKQIKYLTQESGKSN